MTYRVHAYDTSYGFEEFWDFSSREQAQMWVDALVFDYGTECQPWIEEVE